jgi:hypothetical protein
MKTATEHATAARLQSTTGADDAAEIAATQAAAIREELTHQ